MSLDGYITSGRYRTQLFNVLCSACGEETLVEEHREYGAVDWEPESCSHCGVAFEGDEAQLDAPTCWEER